jgi:hypothetical protein
MVNDRLRDDCAKRGHAFRKPWRDAATMERKISAAGSSCHQVRGIDSSVMWRHENV